MSMFHDLNLSKSLMDTVNAVREGKSEDEIKNIQKKYQTESKEKLDEARGRQGPPKMKQTPDVFKLKKGGYAKAAFDPKTGKFNVSMSGSDPEVKKADKMQRDVSVKDFASMIKEDYSGVDALIEKELTQAEKKKREEIAKAIERENPDMPMDKKMAIATDRAKKATESVEEQTKTKKNTKDDVKGGGKVETEPDEGEKRGKKEPVDINPEMTESKKTKNEEDDDPCWDDYKQVGMKDKDGKEVPNCVPKDEDYKPSYGMSLESVIKQVHKRYK